MTPEEEYEAYCEAAEAECWVESQQKDLVVQRFRRICFVSKSRGRNRRRTQPQIVEIVLIQDTWEPRQPRWYSEQKFPWDVKASSEVLPEVQPENREAELIRRINRL
jgi:hypothetical protein